MKVLIADQKLVTEVFPMGEAIPTMRKALTMLQGDVVMPLRALPWPADVGHGADALVHGRP